MSISSIPLLGSTLALTSITVNTTATDACGWVVADTGAATMDHNYLAGTCTGELVGSSGLSGGLDVGAGGVVHFLPYAAIPVPATLALVGLALAGLGLTRRRHG